MVIPAAFEIPTAFKEKRDIRIGSSKCNIWLKESRILECVIKDRGNCMKNRSYNVRDLTILTTNKGYQCMEALKDPAAADSAVNLIRKAIQNEKLETLEAKYGDSDAYFIMVYAEKSCSVITIYDIMLRKSYNYFNKKYENDSGIIDIAGYEFNKCTVCENKEILFEIIVSYFETGKVNEKYEWIVTEFGDSFVSDANFYA